MIERKFIAQTVRENSIQEYIGQALNNVGHSHTKVIRTPLGVRIIVFASRPGLVVGRKGENIKRLTLMMKRKFKLENPQIEISEVKQPDLDAQIVAERIASTLERFGLQRFKAIGHKTLANVMRAGALGVEIKISGKVPSSRARTWRFYKGYLKKSGEIALTGVKKAYAVANMKSGAVGIRVMILTKDILRPDDVEVIEAKPLVEVSKEKVSKKHSKDKKKTKRKVAKRKTSRKKTIKKNIPVKKELRFAELKTETVKTEVIKDETEVIKKEVLEKDIKKGIVKETVKNIETEKKEEDNNNNENNQNNQNNQTGTQEK